MRELTFPGFLARYVRSLSKSNTLRIRQLAKEAATDNPRLREPLFIYAMLTGKEELFRTAAQEYGLMAFYEPVVGLFNRNKLEDAIHLATPLPEGYEKVRRSYLSRKNMKHTENDTKELIRINVQKLQAQYGVTNYRIYKDLSLNPGNLNAWLKHGISNRVSLDTARRVQRYMELYKQPSLLLH